MSSRWRSASLGSTPQKKPQERSRAGSTAPVTPEVRCACQFFQSDSLLPDRINPVGSRSSSRADKSVEYYKSDNTTFSREDIHLEEPVETPKWSFTVTKPEPSTLHFPQEQTWKQKLDKEDIPDSLSNKFPSNRDINKTNPVAKTSIPKKSDYEREQLRELGSDTKISLEEYIKQKLQEEENKKIDSKPAQLFVSRLRDPSEKDAYVLPKREESEESLNEELENILSQDSSKKSPFSSWFKKTQRDEPKTPEKRAESKDRKSNKSTLERNDTENKSQFFSSWLPKSAKEEEEHGKSSETNKDTTMTEMLAETPKSGNLSRKPAFASWLQKSNKDQTKEDKAVVDKPSQITSKTLDKPQITSTDAAVISESANNGRKSNKSTLERKDTENKSQFFSSWLPRSSKEEEEHGKSSETNRDITMTEMLPKTPESGNLSRKPSWLQKSNKDQTKEDKAVVDKPSQITSKTLDEPQITSTDAAVISESTNKKSQSFKKWFHNKDNKDAQQLPTKIIESDNSNKSRAETSAKAHDESQAKSLHKEISKEAAGKQSQSFKSWFHNKDTKDSPQSPTKIPESDSSDQPAVEITSTLKDESQEKSLPAETNNEAAGKPTHSLKAWFQKKDNQEPEPLTIEKIQADAIADQLPKEIIPEKVDNKPKLFVSRLQQQEQNYRQQQEIGRDVTPQPTTMKPVQDDKPILTRPQSVERPNSRQYSQHRSRADDRPVHKSMEHYDLPEIRRAVMSSPVRRLPTPISAAVLYDSGQEDDVDPTAR